MERLHPRQKTRNLTALGLLYVASVAVLLVTWIVSDRVLVALLAAALAVVGGALLLWGVRRAQRLIAGSSAPERPAHKAKESGGPASRPS